MPITAGTPNNMMLAAGADVKVGGTTVGATIGESTFTIDLERYFPPLYGARGEVMNTGYVIRATPKLSTVMAETAQFQIATLFGGLGSGSDATSSWYGSGSLGQMASGDYQDVTIEGLETCGNKSVKIYLYNAYVSSSVDITLSDSEITSYALEFTATYDPANYAVLPCKIEIEK
jgi:hypothetical protein